MDEPISKQVLAKMKLLISNCDEGVISAAEVMAVTAELLETHRIEISREYDYQFREDTERTN